MKVEEFLPSDLDVQKAVVESLAAEKVEQDEKLETVCNENIRLKGEISRLQSQLADLKGKIEDMGKSLESVADVLAKNSETPTSSAVSLIDRNLDLDDRFEGETRDQVIEVIREAQRVAEGEGRLRRAQILESVLLCNEPTGNLTKRRQSLVKLFEENGNILTGPVLDELEKRGISHKNGEEYLLPADIIKRTY